MASKKKAKTTKKSTKPPAKKAAARKAPRAATPARALTVQEKQRLLKPVSDYARLVARLVEAWKEHGRVVRVPELTAIKLARKLREAQRASEKEQEMRARLEAKLRPLADRRLLAEHEAWKSALDLYAMVKTAARTDPAIAAPFDFFADALAKRRAGDDSPSRDDTPSA